MQSRKRIKFSIFLKLIILVLIFIVLANLSIGYLISSGMDRNSFPFLKKPPPMPPPPPPAGIFEYVINDIGIPPDTARARVILNETRMNMRYQSSGLDWSTNPELPAIDQLKKNREFRNDTDRFFLRHEGKPFYVRKLDDGYEIFTLQFPNESFDFERTIIGAIIITTFLAALLYFSLRWIFGPVKKLSSAVNQISKGDFDTDVGVKRNDELGMLADSIDEMKKNIAGMIKSKESLLIDVSHELRSPLTRMKIATEFIDDEKIRTKIKNDVNEMESMISTLLDTYRMESNHSSLNKEKTDIIILIHETIAKFVNADISFKADLSDELLDIDREKIEAAFRNIIDNAIKYSDGKRVEIKAYDDADHPGKIMVSIKDYGSGIDKTEIEKIFEPFYRVDKSRGKKISGYGLGLSLVKKILDMHEAEIKIYSKQGEGTEVIVTFHSPIDTAND